MNAIQNIRAQLANNHVSYQDGVAMREELAKLSQDTYVAKHCPADYLSFLARQEGQFKKVHSQSSNIPYVWSFFSCVSQWVYGDSVEECLDMAMQLEHCEQPKEPGFRDVRSFGTGEVLSSVAYHIPDGTSLT